MIGVYLYSNYLDQDIFPHAVSDQIIIVKRLLKLYNTGGFLNSVATSHLRLEHYKMSQVVVSNEMLGIHA